MIVYFNGAFIEKEEVVIKPDDRGFLFADGIYEVVRWYGSYFFGFSEHMERLKRSLKEIRIELNDWPDFYSIASNLTNVNSLTGKDAILYIQITRGVAKRNHGFPDPTVSPTVYATLSEFQPSSESRHTGIYAITLPDERWSRCDIKTVALLANVLAKQTAIEKGAHEAILIRNGNITEASHSNVFGVRNGVVFTHPDSGFVLPGIARKIVLELCKKTGIRVELRPVSASEIESMDEFFITNTSGEVLGITFLDGKKIGNGKPGVITTKLNEAFIQYRESRKS
jgi:D-alanine transaminase